MAKTPIVVEKKPAFVKLLEIGDYKCDQEVTVNGVWDVIRMVGMGEHNPDRAVVLAEDLYGTKEEVEKFAQEAFGFDQDSYHNFQLVPSKTKMTGLVNISALLRDCGITGKPVPRCPE